MAVAIVCLTSLEVAALMTGQDGAFFMPIVAAISGLVGWIIPSPIKTEK